MPSTENVSRLYTLLDDLQSEHEAAIKRNVTLQQELKKWEKSILQAVSEKSNVAKSCKSIENTRWKSQSALSILQLEKEIQDAQKQALIEEVHNLKIQKEKLSRSFHSCRNSIIGEYKQILAAVKNSAVVHTKRAQKTEVQELEQENKALSAALSNQQYENLQLKKEMELNFLKKNELLENQNHTQKALEDVLTQLEAVRRGYTHYKIVKADYDECETQTEIKKHLLDLELDNMISEIQAVEGSESIEVT